MALGPHSDPDYYGARLFPGLIDLALEGTEQAAAGAPFELKARIPGHDVLEGISVGVGSTLTQSRLTALVRGRVTSPRTEVVVQTTGGLPLVAAGAGPMPRGAVRSESLSIGARSLSIGSTFTPTVASVRPPDSNE